MPRLHARFAFVCSLVWLSMSVSQDNLPMNMISKYSKRHLRGLYFENFLGGHDLRPPLEGHTFHTRGRGKAARQNLPIFYFKGLESLCTVNFTIWIYNTSADIKLKCCILLPLIRKMRRLSPYFFQLVISSKSNLILFDYSLNVELSLKG